MNEFEKKLYRSVAMKMAIMLGVKWVVVIGVIKMLKRAAERAET